jgi:carbon-monoxide dehydrogenase large subunit
MPAPGGSCRGRLRTLTRSRRCAGCAQAGAPALFDDIPDNVCCDWELGDKRATDVAFKKAAHVAKISLVNNRLVGNPMEPRAAIGEYDMSRGQHTLWTTSQFPHIVKLLMGNFVLNIPQHKLRVVSPMSVVDSVSSNSTMPKKWRLPGPRRRSGRPVKWVCERSEGFISDAHGRDHVTEAELAWMRTASFSGCT